MVEHVDATGTPAELAALGYDGTTWDRPWNLPRGQLTTLERMPVPFDLTVTAEQVGSYKPATGHWEAFAQRTEGERGRWVHTAQSWFHDIKTAAELGLPRVWIDRLDSGEDASLATVRLTDLRSLPQAVEQASASGGASCPRGTPAADGRARPGRRRSAGSRGRTTCTRRPA